MSNESTIEQMNEAIGKFMGGFLRKPDERFEDYIWDHESYMSPLVCKGKNELQYHSSWDWLMPVVEKINILKVYNPDGKNLSLMSTLTVHMEICGHYRQAHCSIIGYITYCHTLTIPYNYIRVDLPSIFVHGKKTLIEATYEAVCQFIQWYNNQSTTTTNDTTTGND